MCDERTVIDSEEYLSRNEITRRQFGAGLAVLLTRPAHAQAVTESDLDVKTPDGVAVCYFVHPSSGSHPGVLIWPDGFGLRPAMRQTAKRLAASGYSVLVVNQYYRSQRAPIVNSTNFAVVRDTVRSLMASLNPSTHVTDARAFVSFLDSQPSVDGRRKMGTMGCCCRGADHDGLEPGARACLIAIKGRCRVAELPCVSWRLSPCYEPGTGKTG